MKNSNTLQLELSPLKRKKITLFFDEPTTSSDGGVIFLREVDRQIGLIDRLAHAVCDQRRQSHVDHSVAELLRQRIFQIASGYEDADDCDALRADPAFKTAVGRDPLKDPDLGSQPTMSRLENAVTIRDLVRLGYALIDQFIASYSRPPEHIVLDMDPTASVVHGQQQLAFFNAYENEYCFMPLHVYEGVSGKYITSILRTGKVPSASEILSVLKRLVGRIRQAWPQVRIIFRADSHHAKPEVMRWLEAHQLEFIMGKQPNAKLKELFESRIQEAQEKYERWGRPIRLYGSAMYAAVSWSTPRRVICRILVSDRGTDVRYIVTTFAEAGARYLHETVYCGRGKVELMIKEHKSHLQSDRTSCHRKEANQFRLFVHSAAYVLLHAFREHLLGTTELARAQFNTIRLRLLKLSARVESGKTFIRFHAPAHYPYQSELQRVATLLGALNTS